jgi:hypothetical protein
VLKDVAGAEELFDTEFGRYTAHFEELTANAEVDIPASITVTIPEVTGSGYCIEARAADDADIWHLNRELPVPEGGPC